MDLVGTTVTHVAAIGCLDDASGVRLWDSAARRSAGVEAVPAIDDIISHVVVNVVRLRLMAF